jgi:hypothetical protein
MVHELVGIQNGRVDMSRIPDIRPELPIRFCAKPHALVTLPHFHP